MPRSMHMIKYYKEYNNQLEIDIKKNKNTRAKGPFAFFYFIVMLFFGHMYFGCLHFQFQIKLKINGKER